MESRPRDSWACVARAICNKQVVSSVAAIVVLVKSVLEDRLRDAATLLTVTEILFYLDLCSGGS